MSIKRIVIGKVKGPQGERGKDGTAGVGIQSINFKKYDSSHNRIYTILLSNGQEQEIIIEKGKDGEPGQQGPAGERGPIGLRGDQGPRGPQGFTGATGRDGQDGADGVGIQSINFKEYNESNNRVYTILLSNGQQQEIIVEKGKDGKPGDQGPRGPQGIAGASGKDGTNGNDGKDLEFTWSGTSLGVRKKGDWSYSYKNLKGDQGEQGPRGNQGEKGPRGERGPQGPQGPAGSGADIDPSVLNGKLDKTGGTISNSLTINESLNVNQSIVCNKIGTQELQLENWSIKIIN